MKQADSHNRTPDHAATYMAYGFGADRDGANQFQTTVTDANGKMKESYRDVRELITSVAEHNKGATLWTSYAYDPLKQIVEVSAAKGNLTRAEYDNRGRRTSIDNPDTGKTASARTYSIMIAIRSCRFGAGRQASCVRLGISQAAKGLADCRNPAQRE